MRIVMISEKEIEDFQLHLDAVMSTLFDSMLDEEAEHVHEFCLFIDQLLGGHPEAASTEKTQ
ncbi:MAG: hypothetical protein JXA57_02335 [Armatimonadetes bacterium]|nr:hypothetical protein [Armatimonadota bacterium]